MLYKGKIKINMCMCQITNHLKNSNYNNVNIFIILKTKIRNYNSLFNVYFVQKFNLKDNNKN